MYNCTKKYYIPLTLILTYIMSILYSIFMDGHEVLGQITLFSGYMFYFVLGMYIRDNYKLLNSRCYTRQGFACSLVLLFIGTIFYINEFAINYFSYELVKENVLLEHFWTFISPLYFATITLIFLYISVNLKNDLQSTLIGKIGSYSFAIYLVHAAILYILNLGLSVVEFDMNNVFYFPALFILTSSISIVIIKIVTYIPYNKYLIGNIR
ncbi:acyltransferase family protein [Methanohalophilus sp. RSK]|uniref:acyltransferase family protein n=1 Tax=Methanohalophilus sp. RSK TaxID=2485783 RepID=UPI00351A1975